MVGEAVIPTPFPAAEEKKPQSEHLPRYIVVLFNIYGREVVWPERLQFRPRYEKWDEYQSWVRGFMERYEEVCELFYSSEERLLLALYKLKEGG